MYICIHTHPPTHPHSYVHTSECPVFPAGTEQPSRIHYFSSDSRQLSYSKVSVPPSLWQWALAPICMCVCMYVCMYACIRSFCATISLAVGSCTCLYTCMCACMYVCYHRFGGGFLHMVFVYVYACVCVCTYVCLLKFLCYYYAYIHKTTLDGMHICTHTYIHVHTQIIFYVLVRHIVCMYEYMYVYMQTYLEWLIFRHAYMHIYIHTCIHTNHILCTSKPHHEYVYIHTCYTYIIYIHANVP
jgi:hypothetical protein